MKIFRSLSANWCQTHAYFKINQNVQTPKYTNLKLRVWGIYLLLTQYGCHILFEADAAFWPRCNDMGENWKPWAKLLWVGNIEPKIELKHNRSLEGIPAFIFYRVKPAVGEWCQAKQWRNPKRSLQKYAFLWANKAPYFWGSKYTRLRLELGCMEHSCGSREAFAHEELKMSRIQPSCELHLGGSERERDRRREGLRQAGAKPWRGAFWHNDSHLPLTGLGKVKLIMTAHRCWIALDEVNHWQSNKQVLNDFCHLPWNYRMFRFSQHATAKQQSTLNM